MADFKTKHMLVDDYPFTTYAPDEGAHTGNVGATVVDTEGSLSANFTYDDVVKQLENGRVFIVKVSEGDSVYYATLVSAAIVSDEYTVFGLIGDSGMTLTADAPNELLSYSA